MDNLGKEEILELSLKHNFWTWSAQAEVSPIAIKKAAGVHFWDYDGNRYLDFNSMVMCSNIGHGNQKVIEAIVDQARELSFANPKMATQPRAVLGKLLSEITPAGLDKFLFTLGGADANENAVKFARAFTGKHKILTRYRSYHGATHGAMALTGDPRRWVWEPNLMPGVIHFIDPFRYRSTFHRTNPEISEGDFSLDYLNHLEEIITYEGAETIAAIMIEPVTGTNGIIIPPKGYLEGIRELCDQHNILLIADEVMSGFGRTGKWFAVDHWEIKPDILTMAKGLTSGYAPLGAVAMREEIAEFFDERVYSGGLTYNGHPISLAAAIANIEVIRDHGLIEQSEIMGKILHNLLTEMGEEHPSVGDVRSIGLFGAIELVKDRDTKEPLSPFNKTNKSMKEIHSFLLENGVFLYTHWNNILIIPPLIISEEEISEGFSVIDQALCIADKFTAAK